MNKLTSKKTISEQQPRRYDTLPADAITPPSIHRHALLPLVDVGSRKFEEICRDLLRQSYPEFRVVMKRRSGQEQFGVDVEGFDDLQSPAVVVSAKCYKDIPAWEFSAWIRDFMKHLDGHWKEKGVKEFIIAVSVEANDDDMNDAARKMAAEMREKGIKFKLWDSVTISDLLRKDPQLVDRYFNEAWVKALSADVGAGSTIATAAPFTVRGPTATQGAILTQIENMFMGPLNEALSKSLEEAVAGLRRGKRSAVKSWLNDAQSDLVVWSGANPETKARGLRAVAMVLLGEGDIKTAERLLDEADELARAPDRTARAFFFRARDGVLHAQTYLASPDGRRERELMGALLIEDGAGKEALDVLAPLIGDEVTSEVLRLRALATLMSGGKRSEALNLVTSATSKEPGSAMALFSRGVIRVGCSLADGVTPQLGTVPNPIGKSLVMATPEARSLLGQAVGDFDRLLETVEDDFKREVEVWKLAALLLNQDTRERGRSFARSLFARKDFDPAAVAWASMHGLPLKQGRIKKTLGDAIRGGKGTPSHVAILALLAAGRDSPAKGLSVIEKFAALYPEAEEFFSQFSVQDGDVSANFSAALRYGLATGDVAPVYAYLSTHVTELENLMMGAEFLASRDAFDLVDRLRPTLVAIQSARAVELAAVAALNNGDPRGSIAVLDNAQEQGLDSTRRLSYIRIKAWKALGSHHELIEDIQSQLQRQDDPALRDELLDAYLRIGALDRVKEQAEIVLETGSIDSRKAVQVALALRGYAPETARRALEEVGQYGVPDELAGIVLELASRLGLTSLQDEMIRKLVSDPSKRENFRSFDSVEEVLAMLEEQAKEYRALLETWLYGGIPAAAAMRGDGKDFVSLFLAGRWARKNRLGDPFPMMLRAGGERPPLRIPLGQRRPLRLDLSALLVAHRCRILDNLEECFEIHVPESLPEALVLIAADFHEVAKEVADAVRALDRRDSAVEICKPKPEGVAELAILHGGLDDEDKAKVAVILDRAYQTGHIVKAQLDSIAAQLEISLEAPRKEIDKLVLGQNAFVALARLEILEPLARAFPLVIEREDVNRMLRQVESAEDEELTRSELRILTQSVSEKLGASRWKTITTRRADEEDARSRVIPAHARCLVEVLPRDNEQGIGYLWIEDRTLSKQPLEGLITLPEVLAHLRANNHLPDDRYRKIQAELRRWCYLFLPIDIDEIASVIEAAPVVDGALVENSDLADLRRWFANDLLHLKYLDQSHQTDQQGRIIGEVRRTLDLSSLCSKLIGRIWQTSATTEIELAARSSWIWSNLRLTHMPAPLGSEEASGRRTVAALNAAQMLLVPIHAELDRQKVPEASRHGLMRWMTSSAIGPAAHSDPELAAMIADTAVAMLSHLLETPDGIEASVAQSLRLQMLRSVHQFLELLPDDWEERITSRRDLKQQLSIVKIMLLTIEDGLQVSVAALEETVRQCLADGTSTAAIALHNNQKTARLELSEDAEGLPTGMLVVDRRRYPLHPSPMALVHPEEQVRMRLLPTLSEGGSVGRPLTQSYLSELAREGNAEARVESLHERLKSDFARTKQLMWDRVSTTGSIQLADFDLPPFSHLLNFLGLPGDFRGSGHELMTASATALRSAVGIERAVYRLSSIPFELTDDLLKEFRETVMSGAGEEWEPRWDSICSSLTWLLSCVSAGQPVTDDAKGLNVGLSTDRAKLLVTLLRHSARQAVKDPAWRELPAELAFCLVWLHADQIARIVAASGSMPGSSVDGCLLAPGPKSSTFSRRRSGMTGC